MLDCSGFWASRVGPVDNSLEGDSALFQRKWYCFGIQSCFPQKQFANDRLNGKAFPAGPFRVALYLQHIIEGTHSPYSVDSAFCGLKCAHDVAGTPFPTHDPIVEAVRTASKRVVGASVFSHKEPILPP